MSNPMYFKTAIFNVWCAILTLFTLSIYFYNIRHVDIVASGINTFATIALPLLFVPILVDNIHDISTNFEVENLSSGVQIFILILMIIVSAFSILYVLSYKTIFTQCVELSCYDGYISLNDQKRKAYAELVTSAVDDDDDYEQLPANTKAKIDKYQALRRTDWFAVMNLHLMVNVIWAAAMTNTILTIVYLMRTWTLNDTNINREVDVAVCAGFVMIVFALTIIYDFFFFRTYTYSIFMHYIAVFIYAVSLMIEFRGIVGVEEAVTLVLMGLSAAATVVKFRAGVEFHERKFLKIA